MPISSVLYSTTNQTANAFVIRKYKEAGHAFSYDNHPVPKHFQRTESGSIFLRARFQSPYPPSTDPCLDPVMRDVLATWERNQHDIAARALLNADKPVT
jgi:hypothetical protein